jgi:hypothetical protein
LHAAMLVMVSSTPNFASATGCGDRESSSAAGG